MPFVQSCGSETPNECSALLPRTRNREVYNESNENDGNREDCDIEPSNLSSQPNTVDQNSAPLNPGTRWPSISSIIFLGLLMLTIMLSAYILPAALQIYAKEAIVIEPIRISLESITETGLESRIQANVRVEAARVQNPYTRKIGIICSWLLMQVGTQEARVDLYLAGYNGLPVSNLVIPGLKMDVRNGHSKLLDFKAHLSIRNPQSLKLFAGDWIRGKIEQIHIIAKTELFFRSGILSLGSQSISQSIFIKGPNIPSIHENTTSLNLYEVPISGDSTHSLAARMLTSFKNDYNIEIEIPSLEIEVLVPGCGKEDYIRLLYAKSNPIHVDPQSQIHIIVDGMMKKLPASLMESCPKSTLSPLDALMWKYIHGYGITTLVRGTKHPDKQAPNWLVELLSSITVPLTFPSLNMSKNFGNFSIKDMEFHLPDIIPNPGFGNTSPHISGLVEVAASLPKEINFGLNVTKIRATSKVLFENRKFGDIYVRNWQHASSAQVRGPNKQGSSLYVQSYIKDAPIEITDNVVFKDVVQALLIEGRNVSLQIIALVDIYVSTVLGEVTLTNLPGEGFVPVKI
ncbi:Bgt-863 [Blumeria graminis f. sp. tritici]|uniref:Bgt-863 n=2 Tax=Blumeria graminis f. sp. tritici TaxID=62690 RepID=A0A9X9PRV0_BLUGR|nr:hypothetical protein BGT96224_863 [Blumeria graminis f. sp. tritici 96224]VCU40737.1 Bgt-863 [Blumeria graminis f. sp. tritici]